MAGRGIIVLHSSCNTDGDGFHKVTAAARLVGFETTFFYKRIARFVKKGKMEVWRDGPLTPRRRDKETGTMMVYEELKKAAREKRVTQAVIADRMGITTSFLSRILSGERRMGAAEFLAICLVTGENPADYFRCDELATVRLRMERESRPMGK